MLQCILSKIKSLLLGTLSLISRLLCCLRRRRRNSDPVIPVSLNSASSSASRLVNEVAGATNWDDDDWDNCEVVIDKPRTTSDHIAAYRQQQVTAVRQISVPEPEEPEPDLFADMAPDIRKQRKIFIGKNSPSHGGSSSRLTAENGDPLISLGSELENWDEDGTRGWECDDQEMHEALKSHRKGKR